jgi:hypothetical protein
VVDGRAAWVGTSNWEGLYFLASRNVSFILSGGAIPGRLAKIFADDWASTYAAALERQAR